MIAPQFKHFQKLRDFIEMKLPPGFPVKVDIPVLPTVSARVTFHDFEWKENADNRLSDDLFNVPTGYTEDPSRFPDLWHVDEVGLLTVEERYPWVASKGQNQTGNGRRSWRLKNQVARALVDQDQLEDSCFQVCKFFLAMDVDMKIWGCL